ncbi:hypothetical protein [Mycoplasma hafezii]|uniref:hypothetical protein n=1 Tax=Mycoplasma hafezii TaxID=525886 RepID=UPI003CF42EF8
MKNKILFLGSALLTSLPISIISASCDKQTEQSVYDKKLNFYLKEFKKVDNTTKINRINELIETINLKVKQKINFNIDFNISEIYDLNNLEVLFNSILNALNEADKIKLTEFSYVNSPEVLFNQLNSIDNFILSKRHYVNLMVQNLIKGLNRIVSKHPFVTKNDFFEKQNIKENWIWANLINNLLDIFAKSNFLNLDSWYFNSKYYKDIKLWNWEPNTYKLQVIYSKERMESFLNDPNTDKFLNFLRHSSDAYLILNNELFDNKKSLVFTNKETYDFKTDSKLFIENFDRLLNSSEQKEFINAYKTENETTNLFLQQKISWPFLINNYKYGFEDWNYNEANIGDEEKKDSFSFFNIANSFTNLNKISIKKIQSTPELFNEFTKKDSSINNLVIRLAYTVLSSFKFIDGSIYDKELKKLLNNWYSKIDAWKYIDFYEVEMQIDSKVTEFNTIFPFYDSQNLYSATLPSRFEINRWYYDENTNLTEFIEKYVSIYYLWYSELASLIFDGTEIKNQSEFDSKIIGISNKVEKQIESKYSESKNTKKTFYVAMTNIGNVNNKALTFTDLGSMTKTLIKKNNIGSISQAYIFDKNFIKEHNLELFKKLLK